MYIEPNTKIRLIKNCPLDKTQENTIYFTSEAQQTTYFTSTLNGFLFERNTYQRVNKGVLRVAMNAEALYNCNYLAFQNTAFGNKWFYAFIDKIEYINNVTSEVSYTIDVMQTWHFQYELEQCFVEREHSITDEIGDNIVEEKLETGEYLIDNYTEPTELKPENCKIVLFCTVNRSYQPVAGYWNGFMGSGLCPVYFDNSQSGLSAMDSWINDLVNVHQLTIPNSIVCGCIMPSFMLTTTHVYWNGPIVSNLMRADGTNVRNKKCLIYPYNFVYVTNYQGKSATFRYEFFENHIPVFDFYGMATPDPTLVIAPQAYKMILPQTELNNKNFDELLELRGFPLVPWNIDSFKAWLAQSASSIITSGLAFTSGLVTGQSSMIASGLGGLVSQAVNGAIAATMPPQAHGGSAGAGKFSTGRFTFGFMNKHITPEYASIIDDYFTMFGYACKKVKIPNRNARPEWNYIKTIGCKINGINAGNGGLPADDAEQIENIYNKGVRFWSNPAHIGNYSYNNAPVI